MSVAINVAIRTPTTDRSLFVVPLETEDFYGSKPRPLLLSPSTPLFPYSFPEYWELNRLRAQGWMANTKGNLAEVLRMAWPSLSPRRAKEICLPPTDSHYVALYPELLAVNASITVRAAYQAELVAEPMANDRFGLRRHIDPTSFFLPARSSLSICGITIELLCIVRGGPREEFLWEQKAAVFSFRSAFLTETFLCLQRSSEPWPFRQ